MALRSVDPATEEELGTFDEMSPAAVEEALARVDGASPGWRATPISDRAASMRRLAEVLRNERSHLGGLICREMGKPIVQAEAEIEKCAWTCDFYADQASAFLADEPTESNASESYVTFDPLGTVLAIMPWNFPFWQVFRFAAPALMAGNTAVLKHASNVPLCALMIEDLFRRAQFPPDVFRTLLIGSGEVAAVIADERIHAVTLTGSDTAGSKVAETSGRVIKKTVLELGGSDPFIVLADANVDEAASVAVNARYQNAGQSCIAAKRFIVERQMADEFTERFTERVMALRVGDPSDHETQMGPLARADLVDGVDRQVKQSMDQGAKLLTGGHRLERRGYFYAPTVLAEVTPEMPVFGEETFGPVAAIVPAADAADAVRLANRSQYGLGSALWTTDVDRARTLARDIEAGSVFINGMVASDPRLPFGGVKRSGYGRELGKYGIREFVNIKTVWIGPATSAPAPIAE